MKMTIFFQRSKLVLLAAAITSSATLTFDPASALACAGDDPSIEEETFFAPEVLGEASATRLFYTPYSAFTGEGEAIADFTEINLDDWEAFFNKKIARAVWSDLLYKASLARLDKLIFALKGKGAAEAADQPLLSYDDRNKLIAALYYVGFAKRVEPYATARTLSSGWEDSKPNAQRPAKPKTDASLLDGGMRALAAAKQPFLRQRYALQILRLHFYWGEFGECLAFFEGHLAEFSHRDSVAFRAMGYQAGALYKLKRYAEANYAYSLIYDRYPPMRISAYFGFHPIEEADWNTSLALATSVREKTVMWQMLGISRDGRRALKEIYALDAKSDLLPLLVVREVNRAESEMKSDSKTKEGKAQRRSVSALAGFFEARANQGKVPKPFVWDLAAGHLYALAGDAAAAKRNLDRADKRAPQDPVVRRQLRASQLMAFIQGIKTPSPDDEANLARELEWLKAEGAKSTRLRGVRAWAIAQLGRIYRQKGDVVLSVCFGGGDDRFYRDPAKIDQLIGFLDKAGKSAFETLAAGLALPKKTLIDIKAMQAFYSGDLDRAATLFASIKTEPLPADPFVIHIRDCHDCDAQAPHKSTTMAEFVGRMAKLQKEASSNPANAAELWFRIANGFYNMTCYGNVGHGCGQVDNAVKSRPNDVSDCSRAEAFYRKAMELSKNREFKAKASFMAAKCELNTYYNQHPNDERFKAGTWFHAIRDQYADTQYYKEIIRECGYFRTFLAKSGGGANGPAKR
ncbi:MAG TPA: hypothetical protein VF518_10700 [Polyangia bacterium]